MICLWVSLVSFQPPFPHSIHCCKPRIRGEVQKKNYHMKRPFWVMRNLSFHRSEIFSSSPTTPPSPPTPTASSPTTLAALSRLLRAEHAALSAAPALPRTPTSPARPPASGKPSTSARPAPCTPRRPPYCAFRGRGRPALLHRGLRCRCPAARGRPRPDAFRAGALGRRGGEGRREFFECAMRLC